MMPLLVVCSVPVSVSADHADLGDLTTLELIRVRTGEEVERRDEQTLRKPIILYIYIYDNF